MQTAASLSTPQFAGPIEGAGGNLISELKKKKMKEFLL